MFTKDLFNAEHFNEGLVSSVGNRISNGEYTDAILTGTKYLTEVLRAKGHAEGDGAQLIAQVLGGPAPRLPINSLQSLSEKDEQKGFEQFVRGYYMAVRNPRTHEITEDTEDFCIRVMVIIDTILQYINRKIEEFDISAFVDKIYDPHFVASKEYAETLMSQVPANKLQEVFLCALTRRSEGRISEANFAFNAIYQFLPEDKLAVAIESVGEVLRTVTEAAEVVNLFKLLKFEAWQLLQPDVKMRIENMVIKDCKIGRYDIYTGLQSGALGTWGSSLGRYFTRREDLGEVLISRLGSDWYTQNYVAGYFMYSLPAIITSDEQLVLLAENLSYAALGNKATLVRRKLLEVAENYPFKLKQLLKVSVQGRKQDDPMYAEDLMKLLS